MRGRAPLPCAAERGRARLGRAPYYAGARKYLPLSPSYRLDKVFVFCKIGTTADVMRTVTEDTMSEAQNTTSKYDRERQQVRDAIASLPQQFRLRAFTELRCRPAHENYSFVLHQSVQVVVECQHLTDNPDTDQWQQLGRTDSDELHREIVEVLAR